MIRSSAARPGFKRLGITFLALLGLAFAIISGPAGAAARGVDYDLTNYGYFSDDGQTGLLLIHIEPDDPRLAAELVSPAYAEDILQTIAILDEYWWADNLDNYYINQIEDADEYMVFEGDLNFYDGWRSGYVMLLSVDQEIFLIAGYRSEIDELFELAEETIWEEAAPRGFADYSRVNLDEDEFGAPSNQGDSPSSGYFVCYVDRVFADYDLNGDGVVTIDELEEFDSIPAVADVIDVLLQDGFDGVQYTGC